MDHRWRPRLVWICLFVIAGPVLGLVSLPLSLDDEASAVQDRILFWTAGGFESGPVPDWFLAHRLSVDLPAGFQARVGGVWGGFPDQSQLRVDALDLSLRWQVPFGSSWGVQAEALGSTSLGSLIAVPYRGSALGVSEAVSPRADGTSRVGLGLLAWAEVGPLGLQSTFQGSAVYDGAGGRFGWSDTRRWDGSLTPSYAVLETLSVAVPMKVSVWEGRGWSAEVVPTASFSPSPDWAVSAGIGVPAVGAPLWRALVGVRWSPPVRVATSVQAVAGSLDSMNWDFQVIPEGENLRIRIYFTFLGDRSELFEPQNAQYGPQNRKLMQKLLDYIEKFPSAHLRIEGHTNRANFKKSFDEEQRSEMLPLARSRGDAVSRALVAVGIDKKRLTVVPVGGSKPLAGFDDSSNSWKNRRVEIVIVRE